MDFMDIYGPNGRVRKDPKVFWNMPLLNELYILRNQVLLIK